MLKPNSPLTGLIGLPSLFHVGINKPLRCIDNCPMFRKMFLFKSYSSGIDGDALGEIDGLSEGDNDLLTDGDTDTDGDRDGLVDSDVLAL